MSKIMWLFACLIIAGTLLVPEPPVLAKRSVILAPTPSPTPSPVPSTPTPAPTPPTPSPEAVKQAEEPLETGFIYCYSRKRKKKLSQGEVVLLGRRMAKERGWVGDQWRALHWLWTCESSWRTWAPNGHGCNWIPQACPASKIKDTSPAGQIRWGLNYIAGRKQYRTPIKALQHYQKRNWY